MSHIVFKKNITRDNIPNTWRKLIDDKKLSASIVCSNGHYGIITDHLIGINGVVIPSVVCSEDGCTFHDMIKLEGWNNER